jgi:hypothetical protein
MNKNLSNYVRHYSNFLDKKICSETVKQLNSLDKSSWEEHVFYNAILKKYSKISGTRELSTTYSEKITTQKEIMNKLWHGISDYMKDLNFKWFSSWQGYSGIRFNKYSKNKEMAQHCDHKFLQTLTKTKNFMKAPAACRLQLMACGLKLAAWGLKLSTRNLNACSLARLKLVARRLSLEACCLKLVKRHGNSAARYKGRAISVYRRQHF